MSNMSHCRFNNTLGDLMECHDALVDCDELSEAETKKARQLIQLCEEITEDCRGGMFSDELFPDYN